MDFQNLNEVFTVYAAYPQESGKLDGYMVGRFMVESGKLRILEDHTGMLKKSLENGPVGANLSALNSLSRSPYIRLVAESEITPGKKIDVPDNASELGPKPQSPPSQVEVPEQTELPQDFVSDPQPEFAMQTPPAVFDYLRVGMREPQVLEVRGEDVYMNGQKLSRGEVQRILETIHNGIAKLKYRKAV